MNILNAVLPVCDKLLDDANKIINHIESNEKQVEQNIIDVVVTEGKKLNAGIINLINSLKDGATDDGKAVVDCIVAEKDKTEQAFTDVSSQIGQCAGNEVPVVLTEVKKIVIQLSDLKKAIQDATDALAACNDSEINCIVSFAVSVVDTVKKIPSVVEQDIKDILDLIKNLPSKVQDCSKAVVDKVKSEAQDIFNEAVVCIKK